MKGQVQLEAIICFVIFLAMLGQTLSSMGQINIESKEAMNMFKEKVTAETCCLTADTVYATGTTISGKTMHCEAKGQIIYSNQKNCSVFSKEIRLVQTDGKTTMEVSTNKHYE